MSCHPMITKVTHDHKSTMKLGHMIDHVSLKLGDVINYVTLQLGNIIDHITLTFCDKINRVTLNYFSCCPVAKGDEVWKAWVD